MKNAENVPPVYEIIWLCDASTEQLAQGDSRFFSSSKGTDAEQQKVGMGLYMERELTGCRRGAAAPCISWRGSSLTEAFVYLSHPITACIF